MIFSLIWILKSRLFVGRFFVIDFAIFLILKD